MKSIPPQAVQNIHDQDSFIQFLINHLDWKIQEDLSFDDLTFGWQPEEMGLSGNDLRDSRISQLRPFANDQPWGIFFIHLVKPQVYVTQLRKLIRALAPMKRKHKDYPTWNPQHLLFICTPDWKNYTFAHFEDGKPEKAKLSTFGWEYQSEYVRTLCQFNLSELRFPENRDMFGLDPEAWTKQWSSAFNVKKVTDKFYEEYDKIFREMKKILAPKFKVSAKLYEKKYEDWSEKEQRDEKPVHLFVQNLVNRLMFLKFLEKRRWLDFNPNYLNVLYKKALSEKKNFYQAYLFYVFFAGLNREVKHFVFEKDWNELIGETDFRELIGVLPFLNGGLFEKEPIDEEVEIPNEAFHGIFDLFSRYNFTINEDTPLDVEVAVNPEMLGKVFEESVIARKEKGAYYTPRNIVSFMCREALKNHLSKCNIQNEKAKIEKLVDEHSAVELEAHDAIEIYKSLHNIKVLDPAVGSGAFPVNMMLELIQVYKTIGEKLEHDHPYLIQNKLANPKDVYKLKKQIIQNNLYGVDIEEFAINIARLRFWLSLAVDFPIDFSTREEFIERVHEIEPLPNLLYKLRCGDSLLANYRGVSLEPHGRLASGEYAQGRKQRIQSSIGDVVMLKQYFYKEKDSYKKKEFQQQIETNLRMLVTKEIDIELTAIEQQLAQEGLFGLTKKEREEHDALEKEIARLQKVRDELAAMDTLPTDFPVIWDVEFGEVLNDGGFDVVIANPPYVRQEEIKHLKEDLQLHYECYTGTSDLYVYFYERGIQLLKQGGTITYISSNKFFRAGYGEKLRAYLSEKMRLHTIIDFGDLPVFEATTYPCVVIAAKALQPCEGSEPSQGSLKAITLKTDEQLEHFEEVFRTQSFTLKQQILGNEGWRLEAPRVHALLEKIKKAGVPLEEYVHGKIYRGITTGYNEAFVIDEETKKRLIKEDKKSAEVIKPFLRGRDIKRYAIEDPKLFMIYVPWDFDTTKYPAIFKHLKQFKKKLSDRPEVKEGRFPWFAMSRYASDYVQEFEKLKLIIPRIQISPTFSFDVGGHYLLDSSYIIPLNDLYLLGVMNSCIYWFLCRQSSNTIQNNYLNLQIAVLVTLTIATPLESQRRTIEERVEKILTAKKSNPAADTAKLEREIDEVVYQVYGLTEEEIKIVEGKSEP